MEDNNVEVLDENKEEKVETPKKKSPIGWIILVIILMIGCLVGGYFINESGILSGKKEPTKKEEKKDTKKEEKEPVVTNYAVTDEKVSNLIDNIVSRGSSYGSCKAFEFYVTDKKVVVNDIPNSMAYFIAERSLLGGNYQNVSGGYYQNEKNSFTLDELTAEIKKYLGKNYKFDPKSVNYKDANCSQYNYDDNSKIYNKQETACGWTCGPSTDYKMVKAVDTDGVLKIDVKVIFYSYEKNDSYYSDYAKTNVIGTQLQNYNNSSYDTLFDKGSDYQFTFKLEDGNYVFVSSEPVK